MGANTVYRCSKIKYTQKSNTVPTKSITPHPFLFSRINFLLHRTLCYTKISPAESILLHYTAPSSHFLFRTQKNVRTPTPTTSQKSIAMHLQFVLQYASNLYCSAFGAPTLGGKGNIVSTPPICIAVRLPFVLQYASHSHRSTFEKSWWLWSPECSP